MTPPIPPPSPTPEVKESRPASPLDITSPMPLPSSTSEAKDPQTAPYLDMSRTVTLSAPPPPPPPATTLDELVRTYTAPREFNHPQYDSDIPCAAPKEDQFEFWWDDKEKNFVFGGLLYKLVTERPFELHNSVHILPSQVVSIATVKLHSWKGKKGLLLDLVRTQLLKLVSTAKEKAEYYQKGSMLEEWWSWNIIGLVNKGVVICFKDRSVEGRLVMYSWNGFSRYTFYLVPDPDPQHPPLYEVGVELQSLKSGSIKINSKPEK